MTKPPIESRAERTTPSMRVLHVAAECAPYASTGGLGEVLGALPGAQRRLGAVSSVILPRYGFLPETLRHGPVVAVTEAAGRSYALLRAPQDVDGAAVYLLDMPGLFDREGDPYRDAQGREFPDNALRFGRYCEAVAWLVTGVHRFAADIVHLHDWHAGLVAPWLKALRWRGRCVYSIHNATFHGGIDRATYAELGLPSSYWSDAAYAGSDVASFMNAGIAFSDAIGTVSPRYAQELQTPEFGSGLDAALRQRARCGDLRGVINGIDERTWNPQTDAALARTYGEADVHAGKQVNRVALASELQLADSELPLVAFIGRLTQQKGADLMADAAATLLDLPARYVVVGVGDAAISQSLSAIAARSRGRLAFCPIYNPALVHRVLAAADLLLVPSRFEPCGLVQMYAQRYGTLPVARRTGGLADTVIDASPAALRGGTATGVLYDGDGAAPMLLALKRGLGLAADPATLAALRRRAMRQRFGWNHSARSYLQWYIALLEKHPEHELDAPANQASAQTRRSESPRRPAVATGDIR